MELRDALTQIAEIRAQMARTEVFRGYKSAPVAFSGVLALVAGGIQALWLPDPTQQLAAYLTLWVGSAILSALAAGLGMAYCCRRSSSSWAREITWLAVEQFLPCILAGGLVTLVVIVVAPEDLWLLPGLWQIFFGLGIFASYRLLPRSTFWVALFYLVTGTLCLALARGEHELSPWAMGLPFGIGQLLAAAILYWTLERKNDEL